MPTTASTDLELETAYASGVWIPLQLAVQRGDGNIPTEGAPKHLQKVLAAAESETGIGQRLQAIQQEDWSGGVGVDYNVAECVYTRTPGYATPAGAATAVTLPATNNSNSPIVSMVQYGTDLFAAQGGTGAANTGRVLRSTDGGTTWTNSLNVGASKYVRDLLVFDDGNNVSYLYASVSNQPDPDPGTAGWFYRWNGSAWSSISTQAAGTYSRQRMCRVHWVDNESIGDHRLVVISGPKTISYSRPGVDPFTNTTYDPTVGTGVMVEGVPIKTAVNLLRLAAARTHVFVTAEDNTFDLDELGQSPALTDYTGNLLHGANGLAALYLNEYIYTALAQSLDRVYVGKSGVLQETVGQCGPGQLTRARTEWTHGFVTALSKDQGWLVCNVFNPATGKSGIFWGQDRKLLGVETRNPLAWYGPEIVTTGDYKITAMASMSPSSDSLRFFVAGYKGGAEPALAWVSLPISGAPLDDLISGSSHRFATGTGVAFGSGLIQPYCRLSLLDNAFGSRTRLKMLYQHTINAEGLGSGTKLVYEDRADPTPGQTTYTTSTDVTSNSQTITPSTVISGHRLEERISFAAGSTTTPAVLDAISSTAWTVAPSVAVIVAEVEYGDGIVDRGVGRGEAVSPATREQQIEALIAAGGRTRVRLPTGDLWLARVEQRFDRDLVFAGGTYGQTAKAALEINLLAAL